MSYLINTLLHPLSIFLGVLLILIGGITYYFNNKIKEQNLKIDSVASVVSTIAMEMRTMQLVGGGGDLNLRNPNDKYINLNTSNVNNELRTTHTLINVSDTDGSSSSDDDTHNSYESESDEYESDDSEETENEDNNNDTKTTKILQHDYESLNIDENIVVLKIDTPFFNMEDVSQSFNSHYIEDITNSENDHPTHNEDIIELKEEPFIEKVELMDVVNESCLESEELSQINTIDLEKESVDSFFKSVEVDYKKMTLNKLKEIALEKGLIDESTKLKKQELLKLLTN